MEKICGARLRSILPKAFLVCALLPLAPSSPPAKAAPREHAADPWTRRQWIAKLLRDFGMPGRPASAAEIERLEALADEEIARAITESEGFAERTLDFLVHFAGYPPSRLRRGPYYNSDLQDHLPAAFTAARSLARGGGLKLFELKQPLYVPADGLPLPPEPPLDPTEPLPPPVDRDTHRRKLDELYGQALAKMRTVRDEAAASMPARPAHYCDKLRDAISPLNFLLAGSLPLRVNVSPDGDVLLDQACASDAGSPLQPNHIQRFDLILDALALLFDRQKALDPTKKSLSRVAELQTISLEGTPFDNGPFTPYLGFELANSSTNMNRRRGAYFLRQFFCENLEPPPDVAPAGLKRAHGSESRLLASKAVPNDPHSRDRSCLNCHARLDPMSGFFRDFGAFFGDYSKQTFLLFDDFVAVEREKHTEAWLERDPSTGRKWRVGYIRSTENDALNGWGESPEDLMRLLRTAPEVKSCLARRLLEFYVSREQSFDPAFVRELGEDFAAAGGWDSNAAYKQLVSRVILSASYRQPNPIPGECYDRPSRGPHGALPCQVDAVVRTSCLRCHSNLDNGVDLSRVETRPDGRQGFPHVAFDGRELGARESLETILKRITSEDPAERMPQGRTLSHQDKEALYKWIQSQLAQP